MTSHRVSSNGFPTTASRPSRPAGTAAARRLAPGEKLDAGHGAELYYAQLGHETALVPSYPDLLNPEVTKTFIAGSHETYKRALGRHFGDTIPLVISDEPRVDNPPWTGDLASAFQAEKGYDIRNVLPAIFRDDEATAQVRIDYFDWWSRRFSEAFFGQIQQWSARNGLWSIGHLGGEDLTIGSRKYGFGHVMRVLRKYDIPGVDTIWKQVHPGRKAVLPVHWDDAEGSLPVCDNHHFPKYASSVAHQSGKPWSWTESFAAYGCALTLEEMKWITDFQFVRGINLLISGQALLSTKGHYMGFIRPMFVRENPLFRHLDLYHAYTARLSYLLSLGRPAIRAALYFPVRDIWAGGEELDRVAASNDALARTLLERQCDFDMIDDDDLLEDAATTVHDGCLHAGPMRYDTVYVSRTRHMSDGSREKLSRFIGAGGRVYWVDNRNASEAPAGSISIELDELDGRHVEPLVDVRPANAGVRVCRRDLENGTLYFTDQRGLRRRQGRRGGDRRYDRLQGHAPRDPDRPGDGHVQHTRRRDPCGWDVLGTAAHAIRRVVRVPVHGRRRTGGAGARAAPPGPDTHRRRMVLPAHTRVSDRRRGVRA